jgi:hypothetical protein
MGFLLKKLHGASPLEEMRCEVVATPPEKTIPIMHISHANINVHLLNISLIV